jgi:hypothetical protein
MFYTSVDVADKKDNEWGGELLTKMRSQNQPS